MRRIPALAAVLAAVVIGCSDGNESSDAVVTTTAAAATETSIAPTTAAVHTTEPTESSVTTTPASPTTAPTTTAAPQDEPTREPVVDERFAAVAPIMSEFVEANGLNGAGLVVVERDAGIVHEEYVGEFTRDRVSLIASSSKMITAGVLLRLADDGLLDLDAPVADVVDWGEENPDITPAQLVTGSSGLGGLFSNSSFTAYRCAFEPGGTLDDCGETVFTTEADDGEVIEPDTEFRYGGAPWQVAGAVAEVASGSDWAELIDEIYVQPCGADSLGFTNHWAEAGGFDYPVGFDPADVTPTDNPNMEGGAYITPPDYAELLLMHLRGGVCDGGRVLSEDAVDRAHTDRVAEVYPDSGAGHPGYGFGWWVDRETGVLTDGGAYGSVPWLDLADGYGAYLVIEADSGTGNALYRQLEPVVDAAIAG